MATARLDPLGFRCKVESLTTRSRIVETCAFLAAASERHLGLHQGVILLECRSVLKADEIPWLGQARRSSRYLVGVSGGADSVALLHLLVEAGFRNLVICHLNHRLRGRASSADAAFVQRLARKLGIPCETGSEDVARRMAAGSESMETAARNARHGFFARCAKSHRCRTVILAHHAEDQAETVLWNLFRGSYGFKGMQECQTIRVSGTDLRLIRPLLAVRREELRAWLIAKGLKWREDASNASPVAVRNRLRHEVIPLLREITGRDPIPPLIRGAGDDQERERFDLLEIQNADVIDPQGRLHLPSIKALPAHLRRLVFREYLVGRGVGSISRDLLDRCLEMMDPANPSSFHLPGGRRIRRREGRIWIEA